MGLIAQLPSQRVSEIEWARSRPKSRSHGKPVTAEDAASNGPIWRASLREAEETYLSHSEAMPDGKHKVHFLHQNPIAGRGQSSGMTELNSFMKSCSSAFPP